MTRRRPCRRPAVLTAGMLAGALLVGCGTDVSPGGTVDPTPGPTSAGTDPGAGTDAPGPETPSFGPGEVLTPEDAGAVLRLGPGEEASLHLTPPWQDAVVGVGDPTVVELVPVEHFADPGYAEYTVLARAAGTTTVDVAGPDGEPLVFRVEVRD